MEENPKCSLCGDPMPVGEEMFKFHGYSGPCPKPPLPTPAWHDEFVAYCHFVRGSIQTCDSDAEGAFKVFKTKTVNEQRKAGHDARNKEVATLTAKLQEAERKLEPGPCGKEGHRKFDWCDEEEGYESGGVQGWVTTREQGCAACHREEGIKWDAEHNGKLEPSPCGVEGHRNADWVECDHMDTDAPEDSMNSRVCFRCGQEESIDDYHYCVLCHAEKMRSNSTIAKARDEALVEAMKAAESASTCPNAYTLIDRLRRPL